MLIYLQMIESNEDKSKFEQIYHQYYRLMFYVARKFLRREQDAEDAVHHAFVKIAENITKISEPVCPKTKAYVVVIVENTCVDMLRKQQRREHVPLTDEAVGFSVAYNGDDTLVKSILQLPPKQRQVILLKYHHGYSLAEIAGMLNMTLAAIIKTDQRAKKKLQELCEEGGVLV